MLFRPDGDNAYASEALPTLYHAANVYARGVTNGDALLTYEIAAIGAAIEEVAALLQPSLLFANEKPI